MNPAPPIRIPFAEALHEVRVVQLSLAELEKTWRRREEEAFSRGHDAGERSLREQLVQQRADLQHLQNGLLQQLNAAIPQVIRECEQMLVSIALEAARKVVNGIEITPAMVESAVRDALGSLEQTGRVRVLLHPEDLALIETINSPLRHEEIGGERIRFEASSEVGRGGCLVHTDFGAVDARREVKFELLRQAIES
jgi:flagellar assembly protein FliH